MSVTDEEYKAEARWPRYWIPVEKELPCVGYVVFVRTSERLAMFGYYFPDGWITLRVKEDGKVTTATGDTVTHWCQIPILPGGDVMETGWCLIPDYEGDLSNEVHG